MGMFTAHRPRDDLAPAPKAGWFHGGLFDILPRVGRADRRRDKRHAVSGVTARVGDWDVAVENLSMGGFLARSHHATVTVGNRIPFTLALPLPMRTMEVTGEARVTRVDGDRFVAEYVAVSQRLMMDLYFYLSARE